jgi:hypothetical protein
MSGLKFSMSTDALLAFQVNDLTCKIVFIFWNKDRVSVADSY